MAQKQTDAQKIAALQAKLATVAKTRTDSSRRGPVSEALRSLGIECPWKMAQVTLNVEVEWPTEIGTGAVDESNAYVASRWLYDQDRDGLQAAITSITPVPTEAVDASTLPTTYTEYVTLVGEVFSRMVADQNWCLDGHYYVKRATDLDLPVIVHEVTGSITDEAGKELWSWTRTHRGGGPQRTRFTTGQAICRTGPTVTRSPVSSFVGCASVTSTAPLPSPRLFRPSSPVTTGR